MLWRLDSLTAGVGHQYVADEIGPVVRNAETVTATALFLNCGACDGFLNLTFSIASLLLTQCYLHPTTMSSPSNAFLLFGFVLILIDFGNIMRIIFCF